MRFSSRKYAIILLLLVILLLMAGPMFAQDESATGTPEKVSPTPRTSITESIIDGSLHRLMSEGVYDYDEGLIDDPPWLLRLKEMWRNFRQRLANNPVTSSGYIGSTSMSIIMVVAILVLIVVLFLFRTFGSPYGRAGIVGQGAADGDLDMPGVWSEAGMMDATKLAAAGNFRDAISVLFKSALKGLGNLGWIRYRKSGGSRAYLRQLRRSAELYPVYRDFLGRFEVAYYRKDYPGDEDWQFMIDRYGDLARLAASNPPPMQPRRY